MTDVRGFGVPQILSIIDKYIVKCAVSTPLPIHRECMIAKACIQMRFSIRGILKAPWCLQII